MNDSRLCFPFSFIFILFFHFLTAKPLEVEVAAPSAILMNADSGVVLFEKSSSVPFYPASVTKIATALFVLENEVPLDQLFKVSRESLRYKPVKPNDEIAPYWLETDGTKMGLYQGEEISLEALLHGLMLVSGNDAANVIAEGVGGSISVFMREMNEYLQKLGCQNTRFQNPHGLHHPEHFTTAYDLCLITQRALSFPKFREIVSKPFYMKPGTNKQGPAPIRHTNPLFKEGRFHYPKAIGVKTGFHSQAKNTFVAAAEHEGRTLIAVFLGCAKREDRYEDAIRLFEAAFSECEEELCLFPVGHFFSKEMVGATSSLEAELLEPLSLSFYPAEEPSLRAFIHWSVPILPISKGAKVGEIHLVDERGVLLQKKNLCAKQEVKEDFWFKLKSWFF